MSIRDIAIETAAVGMARADLGGRSLSMRDRRELAAIAFDAAARAIATELRAEGDRLQGIAEQTRSVPGFAHALSFGDASRHVLTTIAPEANPATTAEPADDERWTWAVSCPGCGEPAGHPCIGALGGDNAVHPERRGKAVAFGYGLNATAAS